MDMKRSLVLFVVIGVWLCVGCKVNKKAQLQALADCDYQIESLESVKLGGKDIREFQREDGDLKVSALAGLATALFTQELPLEGVVNLRISNPENKRAAFNSFKYIIELNDQALFNGTVERNVSLEQHQQATVPLSFRSDIFAQAKQRGIQQFLTELFSGKTADGLRLKIKPSLRIANQNIYYPSYITVDENLGKRIFELL